MNEIVIQRLNVEDDRTVYDVFLGTIGYERRARFVAGKVKRRIKKGYAAGFCAQRAHSYAHNKEWFKSAGFGLHECEDSELREWWRMILDGLNTEGDVTKVAIDISSTSRLRLAMMIEALLLMPIKERLVVDFLYAPARYTTPPREQGPILTSAPVLPAFAGWTPFPDRSTAAIFGLGYEPEKAVGALEYIEPSTVWAFRPTGEDARYDAAIDRANGTFWDLLPGGHVFCYQVADPLDCFITLESVTFGALERSRPVLIPLGPKVFSLCCLLVASVHYPAVTVWRVSAGSFEEPVDRTANGKLIGIRTTMVPRTHALEA